MNKQFDNRFDELFNQKFKDFDKNPPDYIFDKVKATIGKQSIISKISNFYKNNILIGSLSLIVPFVIIGFFAYTGSKNTEGKQNQGISQSAPEKENIAQNSTEKNIKTDLLINSTSNNTIKPVAIVSNDESCGLIYTLKAKSPEGKWICENEKVIFSSINTPATSVNVPVEGNYTFKWIPSDNSKNIEYHNVKFLKQAESEKTKEIISCGNEVILEANSNKQNGTWSSLNNIIFKNPKQSKTSSFYNGFGKTTLIWTDDSKCSTPDTFHVIFAEKPDASIEVINSAKCNNSPVIISAKNKKMTRYEWDIDNGSATDLTANTVNISWSSGLKHKVNLKTWSNESCFTSSSIYVDLPAPIEISFDTKNAECSNNGTVSAKQITGKSNYRYFWMNESNASGSFKGSLSPGKYFVKVSDNNNCSKDYSMEIRGTGIIKSSFYHSYNELISPSTVNFVNTTTENNSLYDNNDELKFEWDFGDGQTSDEESPKHTYTKAGTYKVKLKATNKMNCSDTFSISDIVISPSNMSVPNVFSPNGDGQNDVFKIKDNTLKNLHVIITSAKGEKVYEWFDIESGWDGTILKSGAPAVSGIYYYIITAVGKDGNKFEEKGTVQLVR